MKRLILLILLLVTGVCYAPNLNIKAKELREFSLTFTRSFNQRVYFVVSAIRSIESGGNYQALGMNGEYGAYQYQLETWNSLCILLVGKVLDISIPENQDKVSKLRVERLIRLGYSDAQIASIWNCGHSSWEGRQGYNSTGVYYDVPGYVKKVTKYINYYQINVS